jgi:hypothetical protein
MSAVLALILVLILQIVFAIVPLVFGAVLLYIGLMNMSDEEILKFFHR